jgi:uncharacterized membrane protein
MVKKRTLIKFMEDWFEEIMYMPTSELPVPVFLLLLILAIVIFYFKNLIVLTIFIVFVIIIFFLKYRPKKK